MVLSVLIVYLIRCQVWNQKKVWEGFVRCCQRTKPQSFQVLLQLQPPELKSAFEICPDMKEPLIIHVNKLTPAQVGLGDIIEIFPNKNF